MEKIATSISGLYVLEPQVFTDDRGYFYEAYNRDIFLDLGIKTEFIQANHSRSKKGVLRGLHFQKEPKPMAKLVRCTVGIVWDVAVDIRPNSSTFKRWFGIELSADNKKMLYIPEGFAHGFHSLTDSELQYMVSNTFTKELDAGIAWNDPQINIDWQLHVAPILSEKDMGLPLLKDGSFSD